MWTLQNCVNFYIKISGWRWSGSQFPWSWCLLVRNLQAEESVSKSVANENNKWSSNHQWLYLTHRLWITLSLSQTVMEVNVAIIILFLVLLLAFTLCLMPPISIVIDCHNLVIFKKKNLFPNHFRIVWNLSGSKLTRRDQTVVKQSIEIVFPIKQIQSNRSESSFLGWWGAGVLSNKSYGYVRQIFWSKPLKGSKVLFCGCGSK